MMQHADNITLARHDRESLIRTAKACGHVRAVQWLESLPRSEGKRGGYTLLFGDMKVYLTEIATDFGLAGHVRAGQLARSDLDAFCGMLSHCWQTHIGADDVMSGEVKPIIDNARSLEMGDGRAGPDV